MEEDERVEATETTPSNEAVSDLADIGTLLKRSYLRGTGLRLARQQVRELYERESAARDELLARLTEALEFYADESGGLWEKCEDDGEHGLWRQYITGTCHPREVARRALARATNGGDDK